MQINQINSQSPEYPADLREIPDAPQQLFVQGKLAPERIHIAIVGTRGSTPYGERIAYDIAAELARAGMVIVSGLAEGIDTQAHLGALDAGGLTVAVQGRGLAQIYPSRNRRLAERILASGGALMSEYAPNVRPARWTFPERNRIISGLSCGVVIVETGPGGGSMLTVEHAIAQNRTVMAVPGDIFRETSAGCNNLIFQGHPLVDCGTKVLEALNLNPDLIPPLIPITAKSAHEAKLIKLMKSGLVTTQDLIEAAEISAADFANIISLMEITGKVRNLGAGRWAARA